MTEFSTQIKNILKNLREDYFEYNNINKLKDDVYKLVKVNNPTLLRSNYDKLINKFVKLRYSIDENREIKPINQEKIKIPSEYKELVEHVEYIANLPQPEQRTEEWFKMRENMLTASTASQVLDKNPYEKQSAEDLILEKVFGKEFQDNKYVHHGKKYEEVATKIYEQIYNVQVKEYGLVPHSDYSFIGASPDGIATYKTLDNNFTNMIGRMLEIKCPYSRRIKTKGKICGGICPEYYWFQVQQQLECCDLDKCDFWQCSLIEYNSRDEWLIDVDKKNKVINTEEQNEEKFILDTCKKGCIIQLQPKNKEYDEFKSIYIYPDSVDMTCEEYDKWVLDKLTNFHNTKNAKNYYFDKVLYWKLKKSHNVIIERDEQWFADNFPKYKELWKRISYYRKNIKEAEKLRDKLNAPPKLFLSSDSED